MTDRLKDYLNKHTDWIDSENFIVLQEECPFMCRAELVMLLLELSDRDTSIIKSTKETRLFEAALKQFLPDVKICYIWISYLKEPANLSWGLNFRRGRIRYVAINNNKVIDGEFDYGIWVEFLNSEVIANETAEQFADNIKKHS